MIYFEEYGQRNSITIVMLHGANFVHTFGRQYSLAEKYHIIVPHITGFGKEADRIFTTEKAISDISELIKSLRKKVFLVGFSLGAQLAFSLVSKSPDLFCGAVMVSPWLIKNGNEMKFILEQNEKHFHSLQKKWFCNLIGLMNGLPKQPRKEFVEYMQRVSLESIRNSVDNGITLLNTPSFEKVQIPILALTGGKEQEDVKQSVIKMQELNPNCISEIWEKAAHNIPPVFAKRFNERLEQFVIEVNRKNR